MKRILALALAFALCGCQAVQSALSPTYVPNIVDKTDEVQADADAKVCHQHALDRSAKPKTILANAGKIANGAGQGFGNNLALAAGSGLLGPGLGAVGGALASTLQILGVIYDDTPATEQSCLLQKANQHRDFTLAEPMLGGNHP